MREAGIDTAWGRIAAPRNAGDGAVGRRQQALGHHLHMQQLAEVAVAIGGFFLAGCRRAAAQPSPPVRTASWVPPSSAFISW